MYGLCCTESRSWIDAYFHQKTWHERQSLSVEWNTVVPCCSIALLDCAVMIAASTYLLGHSRCLAGLAVSAGGCLGADILLFILGAQMSKMITFTEDTVFTRE